MGIIFEKNPNIMTHILLPTDFSDTSFNASTFAFELFGTQDATYTLVHTYLQPAFQHVLLPRIADTKSVAMNGLRRAERHGRKIAAGKVRIAKVASYEPLYTVLNQLGERKEADLIVMGTQGEGNYGLVGRNTSAVVKETFLPVIAVPSEWRPEKIERILLADDGSELTAKTLAPLVDIAKRTGAFVDVVHVRDWDGTTDVRRRHALLNTLLRDVPHTWEEVIGDQLVGSINDQAQARHSQLVAVVRRQKSILDRIFRGSTSKRMALHTTEPLLVLRERP